MICCLRSLFVDDRDDRILIGKHAPRHWFAPGAIFSAERLPTRHGTVTFAVHTDEAGRSQLTCEHPLAVLPQA